MTDVHCMHRVVVLLALVTGCGAYMSFGVDTGSKVGGGLANPLKQTVTAVPRISTVARTSALDASAVRQRSGGGHEHIGGATIGIGFNR